MFVQSRLLHLDLSICVSSDADLSLLVPSVKSYEFDYSSVEIHELIGEV